MNVFQSAAGNLCCSRSTGIPPLLKPGSDTLALPDGTSWLRSDRAGSNPADGHGERASTGSPQAKVQPGQILEVKIVGTYCYAQLTVLPVVWCGQELWLLRPANRHDSTAIAVRRRDGRLLGYLNRALATDLARYFDGYGLPVPARVTAVSNGCQPFIHVRFRVPRSDALDDAVPSDLMPAQKCKEMPPQEGADPRLTLEATNSPPSTRELHPVQPPLLAAAELPPGPIDLQRPNSDNHAPILPDYAALHTVPEVAPILPSRSANVVEIMERAAAEQRWLSITYCDGWGKVTQRRVLPLARYVTLDGAPGYQCWCALRGAFRTFLFSRVLGLEIGDRLNQSDEAYSLLAQILPQVPSRVNDAELSERANYESALRLGFSTT